MDRQAIENALSWLISLLNTPSTQEADFQYWFEQNPVVFEVYGYTKVIAHPELRDSEVHHIPDFMVQRLDGLWEIFELKRPDTDILRNKVKRKTFYAALEEYYAQCREYSFFFDDPRNRKSFNEKYDTDIQQSPSAILVAGRSNGLDFKQVYRMLSDRGMRVQLQTFDDIRNRLEFIRAKQFAKHEGLPGLTIFLVMMPQKITNENNFILDLGVEKERNRVSVFINSRDELCFRIIDSHGEQYTSKIPKGKKGFIYDELLYLTFEFALADDYTFVSIEINGANFSDNRINPLEIQYDLSSQFVLGSDIFGKANTKMRVVDWGFMPILSFHEKMQMRQAIINERLFRYYFTSDEIRCVDFSGNGYFHAPNHPNLKKDKENDLPT